MMKRALYIFMLLLLCLNLSAQPPIQKFWALNQCQLAVPKLYTKASAAYSLRKLYCNYGGKAVNVRCDGDNTTQDIGFTSTGDLDVTALTNFINAHGVTGTGSINNSSSGTFSVTISPSSIPNSVITAISGNMNGGGTHYTLYASQSTAVNGQTIIVGYYDGSAYTYMIQITFTFGTNTISVQQASPKRISGNYTSNLTNGYSSGATYNGGTVNSTTRIYAFNLTVATANGYVTTWYDQSGNGHNLTQTTQANQPQIVYNGSVNTENGKPTIRFMDISDEMIAPAMNIQTFSAVRKAYKGGQSDSMQYLVSVPVDVDFAIRSASEVNGTVYWYYGDNNTNDFSYNTGGAMYVNNTATYTYPSTLHCICANSGTLNSNTTFSLSSAFSSRGMYGGDPVSELIVFPGILSATDRTRLYTDQKNYYSTN